MIYVGIDDTDMPDTPGTNKLALHLAELLRAEFETKWIVRHQLLEDPRVPCTNRNGCVSLELAPRGDGSKHSADALIARLRAEILRWIPVGSDPGLCVVDRAPERFIDWGRRVQTELVEQQTALDLARDAGVCLEPLGGTGGGVIGALAAVGLLATWNSGRVIHSYRTSSGALDMRGVMPAEELYELGVEKIISVDDGSTVRSGEVDLVKRLRPNMRRGRMVLFVAASDGGNWVAQRVVT